MRRYKKPCGSVFNIALSTLPLSELGPIQHNCCKQDFSTIEFHDGIITGFRDDQNDLTPKATPSIGWTLAVGETYEEALRQNLKSLVPKERIQLFAPEENTILLYTTRFYTSSGYCRPPEARTSHVRVHLRNSG